MDPQTSVSEFISNISGHKDVGESSQNHGDEVLPHSLTIAALVGQDDYFQNAFVMSSSFQTHPINQNPQGIEFPEEISLEPDSGQSNQRKRKLFELENSKCLQQEIAGVSQGLEGNQNQQQQPKQKRRGKLHTISERRRRERIRGKIQALQELMPNCNKWDKASILDDAINCIKSLKVQVEMMSMARGAFYQVPYMSQALMHMRAGMVGMCFSSRLPTMPAASPFSEPAGLPLMPGTGTRNLGLPLLQMPFFHSQLPLPAAATPTMLPNYLTPAALFYYSSQGEAVDTQNIVSTTSIDCQQIPITIQSHDNSFLGENCLASSSPSKVPSSYQ
ncbi:hypothetical protein ERO13_D04G139150v2 [Gossypium hirsutum]|uniref:Transcription factor PHYTOCHROME INTERACTING FACTOR-LIKE 13 n=2 Tax=Gossypium TaxID=3633 RepID=A0A1U8IML1_GOSHI|nr:transcription factor PHYTOCHROME INTERACTING FACTOR-LIKE 13-like [Gossypium hirsutum]KAG4152723.1 hypothetical protein ERO13_D04G139150v2 [Gossypium hirsutum]TYI87828.1 hypothetical protein E1A91_D04G163200v1 [Gossypium mustelinum]